MWVDAGVSEPSKDLFVQRVGLAEARSLHPSQCGDLRFKEQRSGIPGQRPYEEMLSRVVRGDLVVRVRGLREAPKKIAWPESWAVLASQLRITGAASPEAWNAALGLNWHWSRAPGVIASRFFRKRTETGPDSPGNGSLAERLRVLGRFHLGRIVFRLRVLFAFRLLFTDPQRYLANLSAVFTKGFRDHPCNQFGVFRQYGPREPLVEKFPRLRTARRQLPGIALVTPSYQQGRYLESTIRSILEQDYPKLEYAVVDGGSDDESPEIIERYRNRLTFAVSEKDEGQVYAIEKGFSRISGEIMAYMNSDDLLEPGALQFVGDFSAGIQESTRFMATG